MHWNSDNAEGLRGAFGIDFPQLCGKVPSSGAFMRILRHKEFPGTFSTLPHLFFHTHGDGPMPGHDDHKKIARVMLSRVLAVAERWLSPVDPLDSMVRRWLIPPRSMPHKEASMRSSAALSPVQAAIGRQLHAEYAIE